MSGDRSGPPAVSGINDREMIEKREKLFLAPYAVFSADTRGRKHGEKRRVYRSPFQLDRDRIVHSSAFRRLEYKTQVFVNHEGDHYRTRLTHTLEVAQISRAIARALGLNEDLVEAIALAHDLGHAPFGHAGQSALNELLASRGGFNHNLQSLRVVDVLELRYPGFGGLNLTWEVREGICKHGWPEREMKAGHAAEFDKALAPSLEAQLADHVDSIAYDNHDIDDGLRSGYITLDQLQKLGLWKKARAAVKETYGRRLTSRVEHARTISLLINMEVMDLIEATSKMLRKRGVTSLDDVRNAKTILVTFSPEMSALRNEVKDFLFHNLYRHYKAVRMAEKARRFIVRLFTEYERCPRQLPPEFHARLTHEDEYVVICDYIAGMTDRFCLEEYNRLFQPFARM